MAKLRPDWLKLMCLAFGLVALAFLPETAWGQRKSLDELEKLYAKGDIGDRLRAMRDARFVENNRAFDFFLQGLTDDYHLVREQAVKALMEWEDPSDKQQQQIEAAFCQALQPREHHSTVRRYAVEWLSEHASDDAIETLVQAIADRHVSVRRQASLAVRNRPTLRAANALELLLDDDDYDTRSLAGITLRVVEEERSKLPDAGSVFEAEHVVRWLKSHPTPSPTVPPQYVEFAGGDLLPGEVTAFRPVSGDGKGVATLAVMTTAAVVEGEQDANAATREVPVRPRWVRRVVWQAVAGPKFQPNTAFLRDGVVVAFRSFRWDPESVVLLTAEGLKRVPFFQLAELHIGGLDAWQAYVECLAEANLLRELRVYRFESLGGFRATCLSTEFQPLAKMNFVDPRMWGHQLRPAWCVRPLQLLHCDLSLRWETPPHEVPLTLLDPHEVAQAAPLPAVSGVRRNANVLGQAMVAPEKSDAPRWGYGVQAPNRLEFRIPPAAVGVEVACGLDQTAGKGGCAQGIVALLDEEPEALQQLAKTPLLIGTGQVWKSGKLKLAQSVHTRTLVLTADMAHADRPAGSDPLNIRDFVNWIEPRLLLDRQALQAEVEAIQVDDAGD